MKKSNFFKFLKFQHKYGWFELLRSILDPVVQKLANVNKQQNINVNKICLFTFFEDKSRIIIIVCQNPIQRSQNRGNIGKCQSYPM